MSHYYATHSILWNGGEKNEIVQLVSEFIKNIGQLYAKYGDLVFAKYTIRNQLWNYWNGSTKAPTHSIKPIHIPTVNYTDPPMCHTV